MALRAYWAKHRIQLRIAGALVLLLSPLIIVWWAVTACWDARKDIVGAFKETWDIVTKGGE